MGIIIIPNSLPILNKLNEPYLKETVLQFMLTIYTLTRINFNLFFLIYCSLGWLFADFLSGIIHYILDTIPYKIEVNSFVVNKLNHHSYNFKFHHEDPLSQFKYTDLENYGEMLVVSFIPFMLSLYFNSVFWFFCALGVSLTNMSHKWSHARNNYIPIPNVIKYLQNCRILLHPKHHKVHHEKEVKHYCILNGVTSSMLDYTIGVLGLPKAHNIKKQLERYK